MCGAHRERQPQSIAVDHRWMLFLFYGIMPDMSSLPTDRQPLSSRDWFVNQSPSNRRRAVVGASWVVRQSSRSLSGMLTGNVMHGMPGCADALVREPFQNGGEGCWVGFDTGPGRKAGPLFRWRASSLYAEISSQIMHQALVRRNVLLVEHLGSSAALDCLSETDFQVGVCASTIGGNIEGEASPLVPGWTVDINFLLCGLAAQVARFVIEDHIPPLPDAGIWRCNAVTAATDLLILVPESFVSAPVVLSELERFQAVGYQSVRRPLNTSVLRRLTAGRLLSDFYPSLLFGLKIQSMCDGAGWIKDLSATLDHARMKHFRDCFADPIVAAGYGGSSMTTMVNDYLSGQYIYLEPSFGFRPYNWGPPSVIDFCTQIVDRWSFSAAGNKWSFPLPSANSAPPAGETTTLVETPSSPPAPLSVWWEACRWPRSFRALTCPSDPQSAKIWHSDLWASS